MPIYNSHPDKSLQGKLTMTFPSVVNSPTKDICGQVMEGEETRPKNMSPSVVEEGKLTATESSIGTDLRRRKPDKYCTHTTLSVSSGTREVPLVQLERLLCKAHLRNSNKQVNELQIQMSNRVLCFFMLSRLPYKELERAPDAELKALAIFSVIKPFLEIPTVFFAQSLGSQSKQC